MDPHGNPTGCKIYDGQKNEMYKTSYGYRKSDGQLVEERMFDSRVKRIDPDTGLLARIENREAIVEVFDMGSLPPMEGPVKGDQADAVTEEDPYDSF